MKYRGVFEFTVKKTPVAELRSDRGYFELGRLMAMFQMLEDKYPDLVGTWKLESWEPEK